MRIYVQTRGTTADYTFLGAAPESRWWLAFRESTSFEQPTVIVCCAGGEWQCYFSGIPSRRTDRVGTAIRYTVVLEGQCGEPVGDALRLVTAWLTDTSEGATARRVQAAMDGEFDESTVERLLAVRGTDQESAREAELLLSRAMANLPAAPLPQSATEIECWVGATTSADARNELFARISALLRGERDGTAALLNLLGSAVEVTRLAEQVGSLCVLIEDPAGALGNAVVAVEKKKNARRPPARAAAYRRTHGWRLAYCSG